MIKKRTKTVARSQRPRKTRRPEHLVTQLDDVTPQRCPCGWARRAFAQDSASGQTGAASVHLVQIEQDSQTHYHKKMTEIYLVLEGTGQMELDGHVFNVKPMTAIYIPPGCRHRACGRLTIINLPVPAFDASDEWFD